MKQINKIATVESFIVRPNRHNLIVVKITTEQGITGLGCATFQQRPLVVKTMIDEYITPLIIGKDSSQIEDIWQMLHVNGYWRNGPITNNAIAGIDMALWDIKAKTAGMPLYQLFGGKSKDAIAAYTYAEGETIADVFVKIDALIAKGYKHIRCQLGLYGGVNKQIEKASTETSGEYYSPKQYMKSTLELFGAIREKYGDEIELIHDIHERLSPQEVMRFAKDLERYSLFFLEDPLPPEQTQWLPKLKEHTHTPIAIGELFNHPLEWRDLIVTGNVDYIRCHVSQIGGITPALKLMALCDAFGVKIAWHGPSDMTPIGVAVNTHLNIFGRAARIQEYAELDDTTKAMFPGFVEVENGYIYPNETIGIGVEFCEAMVAQYPVVYREHEWTQSRIPDGTIHTP